MINGILLVLGVSQLFLLADFAFVWDSTIGKLLGRRELKWQWPNIPGEIWALVLLLAVSSLWSPDGVTGVQTAVRILVLSVWLSKLHLRKRRVVRRAMFSAAVVILALAAVEIMSGDPGVIIRANVFSNNAYIFGLLGLALMPLPLTAFYGAAIVGLSGTRSALLIYVIWYAFNYRRVKPALAVVTVAIAVGLIVLLGGSRLSAENLIESSNKRSELTVDNVVPARDIYSDGTCGEIVSRELRVFGYGFRGYCLSTGQPRPHNIYQLSVYELGVLSVPFWLLIMLLCRRISWRVYTPLFLLGFLSDDLFSRPEGIYIIVIWLLTNNVIKMRSTNDKRKAASNL